MDYTILTSPPLSYIGWGAIRRLIEEIKSIDPNRILIVTDPVLVHLHILDPIIQDIKSCRFEFDVYTEIVPEPTLETGRHLVEFARQNDYQLAIGIGGGSVLDLTKLAAVFTRNDGPIEEYLNLSGDRTISHKGIPKILIPTTSGTGSEVTNISVLSLMHSKDVITHEYLKADLAIIDPELTISVPPNVTAATGADALTHAIEAYLSVYASPYSDGLALESVRQIGSSLEIAVQDGNNRDARSAMAYGSYLAGLAFSQAGVGAIHALAYPLGGQFNIAHGDSNAVMLPYVLSFIHQSCSAKLKHLLQALGEPINDLTNEEAAQQCVIKLTKLIRKIGIPKTIADFQIPESAIKSLTADGIKQKRLLARCPVSLNENTIYRIYKAAYDGIMDF